MTPNRDDIRRRLGLREVPKPPDDLVRRLKADIPPSFRYQKHFTTGRKNDSSSAFRGMSWQVAASFLALTLMGVGVYMVTFETQNAETAKIAEADRAPEMEFSPPTSPAAAAPTPATEEATTPKLKKGGSATGFAYDIPAPPPPPPPPPKQGRADTNIVQGVEGGVEGGVAGGVYGGVVGGAIEPAPAADAASTPGDIDDYAREQPAESQIAAGRDTRRTEDKGVASASKPSAAPASVAPARAMAKDEKANGILAETLPVVSPNEALSIESLRAKADAGEPLRVGGPVTAPTIVERVEVVYPKQAREARVQGVVIVEALIDRDGSVKKVRVLKSLPMGLDDATVKAVKQWKFKPATLEGKPVDAFYTLSVSARLAR